MRLTCRALVLLLSIVCTLALDAAGVAPVAATPGLRLGDEVRPVSYDAQLTLNPREDRYTGHMRIEAELSQSTTLIWMNATHLEVRHAQVLVGGRTVAARVTVSGRDFIALHLSAAVPAGHASIVLDYDAPFERNDSDGIFKVRDGDEWYVYTQFEPISARRAFPCFDDPRWKTSWSLELTVPTGDTVVASTPVATQESLPAGMKRVRFIPTAPMPSFLVAFAVGPFDVVDGGSAGRNAVPIRFVVPRGHAGELRYAREVTTRLLDTVEDYAGVPYAFDKLDIAAIPVPAAFGAMENTGLITMSSELMLVAPADENAQFRETYASVAAHEIAHHWFGDLVTPSWWDDLWLSESFADWQSQKTLRHIDANWLTRLSEDDEREVAIAADRLMATRAVRAPVQNRDEIDSVFDAMTYQKGASILRMLESWMGEDALRNSVRRYLAAHAFSSVRATDLLAALQDEAGSAARAADITQMFDSMTNQPGVPALDITLNCGADGQANPQLELTQHRYAPLARQLAASNHPAPLLPDQRWVFPACFQYGEGADFGESCTVIRETHQVLALPDGEKCPKWVVGNPRGTSYFLPILSDPLMIELGRAPLLPDEAIAVLGDARVLVQSGDMPIDLALGLAARFADSRQPPVADAAVNLLRSIAPALYAQSDDREALGRYVRSHFGERALRLGWVPRPDERAVDGLLRVDLLPLVADLGADVPLREAAERTARSWLAGRVHLGDMVHPTLITAAHYGNSDLFDAFLGATSRVTGSDRNSLFTAIGSFRDPALIDRALAIASSERTDARDARLVLSALAADSQSATAALRFVENHYDDTMKRLGADGPLWLADSMAHVCDASQRREFEHAFTERVERAGVGARDLSHALEVSQLCIGSQPDQGARLHAFFLAPSDRP